MTSLLSTPMAAAALDSGDTSWLLVSTALVLLMAPGLALFYGGMVRSKSVLNMMMMSFGALAVVVVVWALVGYSVAFGDDVALGLFGDPFQHWGLGDLLDGSANGDSTVPMLLFAVFQGLFCVITAALVSGAVADRARFGAWMVFVAVWTVLVYAPVAHWVFDLDGDGDRGGWLLNDVGLVDYAGGTAVEVCSGASALALALVVGRRVGFGRDPMRPHNLTLVMLGAGLLWFGWFGFNAGSALAAGQDAAAILTATLMAGAAGTLGWLALERVRDGHATSLGAASGLVAGLVAITPSCGVGTVAIAFLATAAAPTGVDGLLYGGGVDLFGPQLLGVGAVAAYAFVVSGMLGLAIDRLMGFRVDEEHEISGIDLVVHAENAYDLHATAGARSSGTGVLNIRDETKEGGPS